MGAIHILREKFFFMSFDSSLRGESQSSQSHHWYNSHDDIINVSKIGIRILNNQNLT